MTNGKTPKAAGLNHSLFRVALLTFVSFSTTALPALAADINVTSGTFEVDNPSDVGANRVVVDNSADADATLKILSGVNYTTDIILNNGGTLINEGAITRTGSGYDGVFGNAGLANVVNQAGGAFDVEDIAMWLKHDGIVLNTGNTSSITGRIGIDIVGTGTVTNELGAEINTSGAGLYLADASVLNQSGATITSSLAEAVRMSGSGDVTNTGEDSAINGTTFGITIIGDGEVYNLDGASISGGEAIRIGGLGTVENEGTITSTNGSSAGVTLTGGGTLTNRSGGSISGYKGVFADDILEITNAGSIEGTGSDGINAQAYGSSLTNKDGGTITGADIGANIGGDITNTGAGSKISGDNLGARLQGGATLRNEDGAEIEGSYLGVDIYDGGDAFNTGGSTITATDTASSGIDVWIYGGVTNSGEGTTISGDNYAVTFNYYDVDSIFSLVNSDKAALNAGYTGAAFFDTAGTVLNEGDATITANSYGVKFEGGYGDVTNQTGAKITSNFGTAIDMDSGGTITNQSGGVISGSVLGLYLRGDYEYTVINTGAGSKISATDPDNDAIFIDGTATVTNADGAVIDGTRYGVWLYNGGSLTNEGEGSLVKGVTTGIYTDDEATIENKTGASISAADDNTSKGVYMGGGGTLTNESGATIFGGLRGVDAHGVEITNTGADSAITSNGTAVQTWAGGGFVTNDDGATMHGGENGVLLDISTELLNESGATIIGDTGNGVMSYDGGIVTNSGEGSSISGAIAGIHLQGGIGTIINEHGATITSDYGAIGLFQGGSVTNGAGSSLEGGTYGIYAEGGATTVSNAGDIIGDVSLSTVHNNSVTLFTGSSIDGNLYINNRAGSTLTFDGTGTELLSDAVTGTFSFGGTLTKQGTGTWVIDKNLLANMTNVTAGGLIVGVEGHGNLISDVHVSAGALLGGSGTIYGNVSVDGTVAPGNSPGVLTIVGDYTQSAGSTFQAQIDTDSGIYDQISATGTVTIDPGAVLNVTRTGSAPYVVGAQYVFVTGTHVGGSYDVTGDLVISPFLTLTDHYEPGAGYLEVQQTMSLAAAVPVASANQSALVNGIQSAPSSAISAVLTNMPSVAAVSAALPQLTGELHPTIAGAMTEDSRYLRNATIDRLEDASCAQSRLKPTDTCSAVRTRFWSNVIGAWAHNNSVGEVASLSRTTGGMLFGVDTTANDFWRAGLLTGLGVSHYEMNDKASTATSDDTHLGFYIGTLPGQAAVKLGALRTWHHISTRRSVNITGLFNQLDAGYHATTTQVFGEGGYRIAATDNKVQPFINLTHVSNDVGSFGESGGAAALAGENSDTNVLFSTLGVHLNDEFELSTTRIVAKGTLGWQNASGDRTPATDFTIGGGSAYRIDGLPTARNALIARADIEAQLTDQITFGFSGDGQVSNGAGAMGLQARLTVSF